MGLTNVWQFDAASCRFAALISSWCVQHWRFGLWDCYESFCFEEGKKTCFENIAIGEIFGGTWSCPPPYKTKPYRTLMEMSWKSPGNQSFIFLLHHWNTLILSQWWILSWLDWRLTKVSHNLTSVNWIFLEIIYVHCFLEIFVLFTQLRSVQA